MDPAYIAAYETAYGMTYTRTLGLVGYGADVEKWNAAWRESWASVWARLCPAHIELITTTPDPTEA